MQLVMLLKICTVLITFLQVTAFPLTDTNIDTEDCPNTENKYILTENFTRSTITQVFCNAHVFQLILMIGYSNQHININLTAGTTVNVANIEHESTSSVQSKDSTAPWCK